MAVRQPAHRIANGRDDGKLPRPAGGICGRDLQVEIHDGVGDGPDRRVVTAGVVAETLEGLAYGHAVLSGENPLRLFDQHTVVEGQLQLLVGAALLLQL